MKNEQDKTLCRVQDEPRVTVLLPVHNGEKYLRQAIESILNQTFTDFELLIINDGSIDRTEEIICSYRDHRIRYVKNPEWLKLIKTLNKGLKEARGEYIARMDADDICFPERLEKQVRYMDRHPGVGILGGQAILIGEKNRRQSKRYTDHDDIAANRLFLSGMNHPSVMMRTSFLRKYSLMYDEACPHSEDRDLWSRASQHFKLANLKEAVIYYRKHKQSVSRLNRKVQMQSGERVIRRELKKLEIDPSEKEMKLHRSNRPSGIENVYDFMKDQERWLLRLAEQNKKNGYLNPKALEKILHDRWYLLCAINTTLFPGFLFKYCRSPLAGGFSIYKVINMMKLVYRSILKHLKTKGNDPGNLIADESQ